MQRNGIVLADGGTVALTARAICYDPKLGRLASTHEPSTRTCPANGTRARFAVIDTARESSNLRLRAQSGPRWRDASDTIATVINEVGDGETATFTVVCPRPRPAGELPHPRQSARPPASDYLAKPWSSSHRTGANSRTFKVLVTRYLQSQRNILGQRHRCRGASTRWL